jgi:hypothetical protein
MIKLPMVVSIVLCEGLSVDPIAGKTSLVGIFHARFYRRFPSPREPFTAFVALLGGAGEGTMELRVIRLETEQVVYSYKRWNSLPGSGVVLNLEMRLANCRFPAPGRYGISVSFDGQELTTRYLEIIRKKD